MMKNAERIGAFAAMVAAVLCSCETRAGGVEPVDWSAKSGVYVVPADTTNEITTAQDFTYFTNQITRLDFANANSTLRFTVPTYPNGMTFNGYGTVLMSEKVLLSEDKTKLKHSNGSGDGTDFIRFVFAKGIDSDDGVTKRNVTVDPESSGFKNAAIYILGPVAGTVNISLNTRIVIGEGASFATDGNTIAYNGRMGMFNQRGGVVLKSSSTIGSHSDSRVAFLMEGGVFTNGYAHSEHRHFYSRSRYLNFRQTGGLFYIYGSWIREDSCNNESNAIIPTDFMFDGSAVATNNFGSYYGPLNIGVMGNADVRAGQFNSDDDYHRYIIALNGGSLTMDVLAPATNTFFAFNGGILRSISYNASCLFGNTDRVGNPAWVRVYENGGCVYHTGNSVNLPAFRVPAGNVLQSVAMSAELASKVWQTPPAVEIIDSTGAGSNAVAIVDYDFDSGKVTNITVVCRGENYSGEAGAVTANLRYKDGDALLTTPLVCTVGPCESGGMTFFMDGNNHNLATGCATNTYRGLTVIDIDHSGQWSHVASSGPEFVVDVNDLQYLPLFSSTGLVVRSGQFGRNYVNSFRPSLKTYFPDCARFELYGGHFWGFAVTNVTDIVVGGEAWLTDYSKTDKRSSLPEIAVPSDGTLLVDYGASITNGVVVTPSLKYGYTVTFKEGAKVGIKDWNTLPRGKRVVALDLSELRELNGTPTLIMSPDDGVLVWSADDQKLYAKRHADGFFLLFR